jgi:high-affinity iron transporter
VTWADVVPNLLIGLREGLEAGLIVIILLAARRAGRERDDLGRDSGTMSTAPVWLGVLAAVILSGVFAAVVAISTGALTSRAQQAADGLLSVLAVSLVTAMIFWMWSPAASLNDQVRGEVAGLTRFGARALTITAFLVLSREGVETTLFVWTSARASGQTAGPLAGAAAGLALALLLTRLMYRRAIRLNVVALFNWTALALIVVAAGMLSRGLGNLQDAGMLAGQRWIALDLTAHNHPGSWLVALICGVTDLSPKMTVLQVATWIAYLALAISAYVRASRTAAAARGARARHHLTTPEPARRVRLAGRRPWAVAGVLSVVPLIAAGMTFAVLPAATSAATLTATVTVTKTTCAREWTSATAGTQIFTVDNQSGLPGEINLDDASGDIVAEIETIGPGTSAQLTATLASGTYVFKCFMGSQPTTTSAAVRVVAAAGTAAGRSGAHPAAAPSPVAAAGSPVAVKPVTVAELAGPNKKYEAYATRQLATLARAVARIEADLHAGNLAAAREDWLTAQMGWERVGASYDSFGPQGLAVDGLPNGLPRGVSDEHFTGLHRLEYGLWHGQSASALLPVATTLAGNVTAVQGKLTSAGLAGDPANLPLRAHEILEDALRDHLSGLDDQGGGAAFAETYADIQVTRVVLGYLTPLLEARQPALPGIADEQLSILQRALLATRVDGRWESLSTASVTARDRIDAAIGAVLETLSAVPDLLEVPPVH